MKYLSKSEFLSFLYSEKDRINSNFNRPGWSNWAIAGSFVGLIIYLFNLLITSYVVINLGVVLMLFISLLSLAIILIMLYPILFPKEEIYYPNKITTIWEEVPFFEFVISGFSFLSIFILLLINHNHTWLLYVMGFLSLDRLLPLCVYFYKRNELVPSGIRFNIVPNNGWLGNLLKAISFALFTAIMIYSSSHIIDNIEQYIIEFQTATTLTGIWILIYLFFRTNLSPNRMVNYLDNIIDKVAYSNMSQQDALEELMFRRYGGGVKQVVGNDLSTYFNLVGRLNDINTVFDNIIKSIEGGKLDAQTYFEWSKYVAFQRPKLNDANSKGAKLVGKINKIFKLPNNAKYSTDFEELLELVKLGQGKIRIAMDKYKTILGSLCTYKESFYCRKSGSLCLDMQCKKRNDKMSFLYACKVYSLKHALKLFIYRKL